MPCVALVNADLAPGISGGLPQGGERNGSNALVPCKVGIGSFGMDGCFAAHPADKIISGSFGGFYVFQHTICPFHIGFVSNRRAAVCIKPYGIGRLRLTADGETVLRPAAKASRAADRHLGRLFGIKPVIAR